MNPILSCYIVDDEPFSIEALKEHVLITPELLLVGTATNPFEALAYLQEHEVSLLFLDINMGKISGMDFPRFVTNKIIWVTAHEKYALQSYDYENTVDYLVKPIMYDRFQLAVKKALQGHQMGDTETIPMKGEHSFVLKTAQGEKHISYSLIDYIEANRNSSTIFFGNEKAIVYTLLKDLEASLPANLFVRVHKSYIINRTRVKTARFNKAVLHGNIVIPIGRAYKLS